MKRILKFVMGIMIFVISFICIDGFCARFLGTRPIISKKEMVIQGGAEIHSGYVYKSLFADVYYCNTIVESYDANGKSMIVDEVRRYYINKDEDFVCDTYINLRDEKYELYREEAKEYRNILYMRYDAEGRYRANYDIESYNKKLNVFTYNYLGDYYVDSEYQDIYMFDIDDFSKEPVRLELDGFDLLWRTVGDIKYSPSGNIMVFEYFCGYRSEQWMGEQKYTEDDCNKNSDENGVYVFRVNDIDDYSLLGYFSDNRNEFVSEYKDSYFHIYDVIDDENIIIKYTVTNNKHMEPEKEVYYKWNITLDTLTEWQV